MKYGYPSSPTSRLCWLWSKVRCWAGDVERGLPGQGLAELCAEDVAHGHLLHQRRGRRWLSREHHFKSGGRASLTGCSDPTMIYFDHPNHMWQKDSSYLLSSTQCHEILRSNVICPGLLPSTYTNQKANQYTYAQSVRTKLVLLTVGL